MDEHDDDLAPEVENGAEMETERYADEDVDDDARGELAGDGPADPMNEGDESDEDDGDTI